MPDTIREERQISAYVHEISLAGAILLTAFSQVLIRLGAKDQIKALNSFLNVKTIAGYVLYVVVILMIIFAMQKITMRETMAWNSITYVITPIAARFFIKDRLTSRMLMGAALIAIGIVIFSI